MNFIACDRVLQILLLVLPLIQGCAHAAPRVRESKSDIQHVLDQIALEVHGKIGAAVCLLETGETAYMAQDQRFPMQSVYKMPIAMAFLREVEARRCSLDQNLKIDADQLKPSSLYSPIRDKFPDGTLLTLGEIMRFSVSESDNVASDILLRLAGGPENVTRYLQSIGLNEIVVSTSELEMDSDNAAQYRNWATPRGALQLLIAFHNQKGISPENKAVLNHALTQTIAGPRRIKGLLPEGTVVAHKTGTSGTVNGLFPATNDIGIVTLPDGRHLAIAVFVSDCSDPLEIRESVIARISRAAYDFFVN